MKRIISLILSFIFIFSVFTFNPFALNSDSIQAKVSNTDGTRYFTAMPAVYEMGDGYAVIWATSFDGTGYIQYTYKGKKYTVYDEKNGSIRTDDNIHVVKVPHEHLSDNEYTVYSRKVTSHGTNNVQYEGTYISAGPIKLKGYDGGSDLDLLVLTDVHDNKGFATAAAGQFGTDPDLVLFTGDLAQNLRYREYLVDHFFAIPGAVTGGRYPVVYCRGNHETRGKYSTDLLQYFPTETGEFYFDFEFGPLYAVVLDTAEDKDDVLPDYGGLANYKEYLEKQEAWLRTLRMNTKSQYRLGIYHNPWIQNLPNGIDYSDSISHLGLQLALSGHNHAYELYPSGSFAGINHPTYTCGGPNSTYQYVGTCINLKKSSFEITSKSINGTQVKHISTSPSSYVGEIPSPLSYDHGLNAHGEIAFTVDAPVSIISKPSVFETGGDWYNVVWATDKDSVGYVKYVYGGKSYKVYDEVAGFRKTNDSVHSVKIPKEHLKNNSYSVGNFHYTLHDPGEFIRGASVESESFIFEDRSDDKALNILAFPDIKNTGISTEITSKVKQAIEALGDLPSLVVLNGDISYSMLNKEEFKGFLSTCFTASCGIRPVVFSRGNVECRGAFAPYLIDYLPTSTGGLYYSFRYGEYTFINLDTAEDADDGQFSYETLYNAQRDKQKNWVKTLPNGKIIVISHLSLHEIKEKFNLDLGADLINKGALLNLAGNAKYFSMGKDKTYDIYTLIAGGYAQYGDTNGEYLAVASSILLSEDYLFVESYRSNGNLQYEGTFSLCDVKAPKVSIVSQAPPKDASGVYHISEAGHILWLSQNCNSSSSFAGEKFALTQDVDMRLYPMLPIGGNDVGVSDNTSSFAFSGTFDGNGYSIKNLNIQSKNDNVGLFGVLRGGVVKNLQLQCGYISGNNYVGGIAGYSHGSTIADSHCNVTVVSKGGSVTGGVVGCLAFGSAVRRCGNLGDVITCTNGHTGGIAARMYGSDNIIVSSYNRGDVINHDKANTGGIVGRGGSSGNKGSISNCYNSASVLCQGGMQGSIMGYCDEKSYFTVSNSYYEAYKNGASSAFAHGDTLTTARGTQTSKPLTKSVLTSDKSVSLLGDDVYTIVSHMNNGYPIHINQACKHLTLITKGESGLSIENLGGEKVVTGEHTGTLSSDFLEKFENNLGLTVDKIATGGVVSLVINGHVYDEATLVLLGDVDGSGDIDSTDYLRLKYAFLGSFELTGVYFSAADMDLDGELSTTDYMKIKHLFLFEKC